MVLKLLENNSKLDEVIFFDTGMEYESIYKNRDKIKAILVSKGIKYTELKNPNNFLYDMLIRPVKYRDKSKGDYHFGYEWCGGKCRWGTRNKVDLIQTYYKSAYPNEEIYEYVGIAYDEPDRIKDSPYKIYPLVELEMTEKDCLAYCYEQGFDWNENGVELYSILDRVSCWCCANKNLKELKNIYLYLPEYWLKLKGLQSRLDRPLKGEGKSVFELEERFRKEIEDKKE